MLVDQLFSKIRLMSYNNPTTEVEIVLVIKKIQVLRPLTFESYSFSPKIKNSIRILGLITFGGYNFP